MMMVMMIMKMMLMVMMMMMMMIMMLMMPMMRGDHMDRDTHGRWFRANVKLTKRAVVWATFQAYLFVMMLSMINVLIIGSIITSK